MKKENFFKSFWGGIVIAVLVIVIAYAVWSIMRSGGITFAFTGPDEARAGETKSFHLVYNNNSRIVLEDANIEIHLPEGIFSQEEPEKRVISYNLGEIPSRTSGEKEISLIVTGEPRTAKSISATFRYRPKTLSSTFVRKENKNILVTGSVFRFDLVHPNQVFPEQVFPLDVNWENLGQQEFNNIQIKPEWPEGLIVQESVPTAVSETGTVDAWSLGSLGPAAQGRVLIKCFVSGRAGETKKIVFNLGINKDNKFYPLAKTEGYITLVANPLSISSLVNNQDVLAVNLGDKLDFVVTYQNNYSSSLRNLVVTTKFIGDVFDFSTLKLSRGTYSSHLNTITWTGAHVPQLYVLNPGEQGTLNFSVKLKKDWSMESLAQKNIIMEVRTNIESSNIPEQMEVKEIPRGATINSIKLNSKTDLIIEDYFRDAASRLVNTGSLPLQVNRSTDFTIHWKIANSFNALKNVTVMTTLPTGVQFTGKVAGNYGVNPPSYNAQNRVVSWELPLIPAGSGVIARAYEAIFQIRVTPSSSQLHQAVELTGKTELQGEDAFTMKKINLNYPVLKSNRFTDKTLFPGAGIVQP